MTKNIYPHTIRAIRYTMTDDNGKVRTIIIDLLYRADIGEAAARTYFLTAAIDGGYTYSNHTVTREEIA